MAVSTIKNENWLIREITFTYSINASGTYNRSLKNLIDNDIPSGYSFMGLCGYASNNVQVITNNFGYYESDYSLQLANRSNTALNNQLYRVFYIAKLN